MKKLFTLALAVLSLTACAKQTKDMYEVDEFQTKSGKTVRLHALVHSSIRIEFDGKEIEVDPCGKLGDRTIDYSAFPKADYIIVTHEHYDHLDKATIKQLNKEGTQVIANQRSADEYGAGTVMANGDKLQLADDISIEAVAAYNTTDGHRSTTTRYRSSNQTL